VANLLKGGHLEDQEENGRKTLRWIHEKYEYAVRMELI
jgi:hypothetical protein